MIAVMIVEVTVLEVVQVAAEVEGHSLDMVLVWNGRKEVKVASTIAGATFPRKSSTPLSLHHRTSPNGFVRRSETTQS